MIGKIFIATLIYALSYVFVIAQNEPDIIATISVHAGDYERFETPVSVSLDDITHIHEDEISLFEIGDGEHISIPIQLSTGYERRIHWLLGGTTPPGKVRVFHLVRERSPAPVPLMKVDFQNGAYVMMAGDKPVLQYNAETVYPPEGASDSYRRSGFIHPLYSPDGTVLTAIQPPDHMHHYGIWNPWTRTTFRGEEVDFWNLAKEEGRVHSGGITSVGEGVVYSKIGMLHQHIAWPGSAKETIAMNEHQEIKVYNRNDGVFMIDIASRLSPVETLVLEEYRYGGFVLRGTGEWTNQSSDFYTSRSLDRDNADGRRAEWCVVSGVSRTGTSGILMMGFPANFNHPEPLRVWPSDANRGRGDVFINFSPTRNTSWTLEPGRNYLLRYRLMVFEGEMDSDQASRLWNDYSSPPKISVEK